MNVRTERTGTWDVTLYTHSGMRIELGRDEPLEDAKDRARRFLRRSRRLGMHVAKLEAGRFEITGPDDQAMVGDDEGILSIRPRVRRFRVVLGRRFYLD